MKIIIELTDQEWQIVSAAIVNLPYARVVEIIKKMDAQFSAQIQAAKQHQAENAK